MNTNQLRTQINSFLDKIEEAAQELNGLTNNPPSYYRIFGQQGELDEAIGNKKQELDNLTSNFRQLISTI